MLKQGKWWSFLLIGAMAIGLSGAYASTGVVVKQDPARNIYIPDQLTAQLKVKAAYNDEEIFWRFEWDSPKGFFYHDYVIYKDGKWVQHSPDGIGPDPDGVMEDRLAFFVDDGAVDLFDRYGGFLTITDATAGMTREASKEQAQAAVKADSLSKFLPETRRDPTDWTTIKSDEELQALTEAGYFLDLWHWRAHRSNPIGYSDDQHVAAARTSDPGKSPYGSNWDSKTGQPLFMFDPAKTGQQAMRWEKVLNQEYTQADYYYLTKEIAVPYDPAHQWQEGDVLPRRMLQVPTESHGDIFANGVWQQGTWHLDLTRKLDTGSPTTDKILRDGGKYHIAFALHQNATSGRWHYISMPYSLGLGQRGQIQATKLAGAAQPDWDAITWTELPLIYPGQITWNHLISDGHAGAEMIRQGAPYEMAHKVENLAFYAVESEFRQEIRRQWLWTTAAVAFFFLALSFGVVRAAGGRETELEIDQTGGNPS